jgi:hypothetical protein
VGSTEKKNDKLKDRNSGIEPKMTLKFTLLKTKKRPRMPKAKPKSPTLLTIIAFMAALLA